MLYQFLLRNYHYKIFSCCCCSAVAVAVAMCRNGLGEELELQNIIYIIYILLDDEITLLISQKLEAVQHSVETLTK